MDVVLTHLRENYVMYLAFAACLLPLVYFTRRWSVPIFLYAVEITIYLCIMHLVMHGIVALTAWFKDQSSMKRAFSTENAEAPNWHTPLLNFWDKTDYDPIQIFYAEIIIAMIVLYAVWRLRPLKVQHKRQRTQTAMKAHRGFKPKPVPKPVGRRGRR